MRRGCGLGAADLMAINRDGELCIALPRVLGDLQGQRVGPTADGDRTARRWTTYGRRSDNGGRSDNGSAATESRIPSGQTLCEPVRAAVDRGHWPRFVPRVNKRIDGFAAKSTDIKGAAFRLAIQRKLNCIVDTVDHDADDAAVGPLIRCSESARVGLAIGS